jgi:hypothetical protein
VTSRQIRRLTSIKSNPYTKIGDWQGRASYILFPSPKMPVGAATVADNRQLHETNRDAMHSPNFHLPILSAMLLLISV